MKQVSNSFTVTGFVGKDAEIRSFGKAAVARFSLAVSHGQKNAVGMSFTSAFLHTEIWRKDASSKAFALLKKGARVTVEGYFKPEEWNDPESGQRRSHIVLAATRVSEALELQVEGAEQ